MPTTNQLTKTKTSTPVVRAPRRLSPELSELMHMLSSLDAKSPSMPNSAKE